MDYLVMNIVGYVFYGFYSTLGYFFHEPGAGTVVFADLFFVYHALLMCLIWCVQACIYPRGNNRLSGIGTIFMVVLCLLVGGVVIFTEVNSF